MKLREVMDIRSSVYDMMEESVKELSMDASKDISVVQEANISVRGKVPPIIQVQRVLIAPVILNSIKILKTLDQTLMVNDKKEREGKLKISNALPKPVRGEKKEAIIGLLEKGYTNKGIVEELGVSDAYVRLIRSTLEK